MASPPSTPPPPRRPRTALTPWWEGRAGTGWRRATAALVTPQQVVADIAFGVVLTHALLWVDLHLGQIPLSDGVVREREIAVVFATVAAAAVLVFHLARRRAGPCLAGVLFATSAAAFVYGLVILPVAVFGVCLMGVGLLGSVPFAAGFCLLRCGVRAFRGAAGEPPPPAARRRAALAGAVTVVCSLALAALLSRAASQAERELLAPTTPENTSAAVRDLRVLRIWPGVRLRRLARAARSRPGEESSRLHRAWREVTGSDLPGASW